MEEDNILLQVMKIPWLDGKDGYQPVLWDTACSGIFVRTKHAEMIGFPCQKKRLHVRTLGGDEKEIDSKIFACQIKDLKGQIYQLKACR